MDFTYDTSGTAQQVAWAQQAVAACTYPLDAIGASVTVVWGALPGNTDSTHPYMVTTVDESTDFTIHITPDADNPKAPINQGLSDPETQVQGFYMESVIHELGHVVTYSTFDPGGDDSNVGPITQMCALFWHAATGMTDGRRYGTFDDWDAPGLAWVDEIREGVAEAFKVGFNSGPRVFWNRSHWNIDADNWATYLALISPAGGEGFTSGSMTIKIDGFSDPNVDAGTSTEVPVMVVGIAAGIAAGGVSGYGVSIAESVLVMAPGGDSGLQIYGPGQNIYYNAGTSASDPGGFSAFIGAAAESAVGDINSNAQSTSMPDFPCWFRQTFDDLGVTAELWSTDPALGGSPDSSTNTQCPDSYTTTPMSAILVLETYVVSSDFEDLSPAVSVSEWSWPGEPNAIVGSAIDADPLVIIGAAPVIAGSIMTIPSQSAQNAGDAIYYWEGSGGSSPVDAPYPFVTILGSISTGSALRGSVTTDRVGHHGRLPIAGIATEIGELAITTQSTNLRGLSSSGTLRGAVTVDG